jgi:hypothetical protein
MARNFISQLLTKDPLQRPTMLRALIHPFLTGKSVARMAGEAAEFDVFLSYRVASDSDHVELVYQKLTERGLRVWWDKKCLLLGQSWEEGFCDGIVKSLVFVPLLSRGALNHPDKAWQNVSLLSGDSNCDNCLLEYRLADELKKRGFIKLISPLFIGDAKEDHTRESKVYSNYFASGCHPSLKKVGSVVIKSLEMKFVAELERQGLGSPFAENLSIESIVNAMTVNQGIFIEGDGNAAFDNAVDKIVAGVRELLPQPLPTPSSLSLSKKSVSRLRDIVTSLPSSQLDTASTPKTTRYNNEQQDDSK